MTLVNSLAIGVRVYKSDGSIISVDDLSPLLAPTDALLENARRTGLSIDAAKIRKSEHSLTLASIDGIVVFLACLTEETAQAEETRYLVQARRQELGTVFGRIMGSETPPSLQFDHDTKTVAALFMIAAAFQAAQQLVQGASSRKSYPNYNVEAKFLRVASSQEEHVFEIVPTGFCRFSASESFH